MDPSSGYCRGCLRTIEEITAWGGLSPAAKGEILERLPGRRHRLSSGSEPDGPSGEHDGGDTPSVSRGVWMYNYETFPLDLCDEEFRLFRDILPAGTTAPDGILTNVRTRDAVSLSSLWKVAPLVLEFGSFT
jgi:predicted Fe-S protein YdhL (DUF1289 family)